MTLDTKHLRELLAAATPGPWTLERDADCPGGRVMCGENVVCDGWVGKKFEDNPALVIAAVNSLPALLDEVERLRAELAEATAHIGALEEVREGMVWVPADSLAEPEELKQRISLLERELAEVSRERDTACEVRDAERARRERRVEWIVSLRRQRAALRQLVGLQATAVDLAKEAVAVASQAPANQRDRDRYVATAEQLRAERDAARAEVERLAAARAEVERLRSRIATLESDLARVKEAGDALERILVSYIEPHTTRCRIQERPTLLSSDGLCRTCDAIRAYREATRSALSDAAGGAPQSRREEDGDALATAALDLLRATDRYQDTPEGQAVRAALNRWGDAAGGATTEPGSDEEVSAEALSRYRVTRRKQAVGQAQTPTPPPCTHHWVLAAYGPSEGKYSCVKCGAILERPASPGGGEGT